MQPKMILTQKEIDILLQRMACELIEKHKDFQQSILIGIQPRGIFLLNRIAHILKKEHKIENLQIGTLDITFFRDDFRRRKTPLQANTTEINTSIENKKVILIDDVLFTGRSVRSALTAIDNYGRPASVELMVLIDRRFKRDLPIQPTYKGKQIDTFENEKVMVRWKENNESDKVWVEIKEH